MLWLTARVAEAVPVTYTFSGTHYTIDHSIPYTPLAVPDPIAGAPGTYSGAVSGSVTFDPALAEAPNSAYTNQTYQVITGFSLVVNGLELALPPSDWPSQGLNVLNDFPRGDGTVADGVALGVATVLPIPGDAYLSQLSFDDEPLPGSALSSTAIPEDLRTLGPWRAEVLVFDSATSAALTVTADVEITSRTVPEPSCAAFVLALCAARLIRSRIG